MVEDPNQSQPNPGLRPIGTPCMYLIIFQPAEDQERGGRRAEAEGGLPGGLPSDG